MRRGFIDLHCHWLAGVDDGARDIAESKAMLRGLAELGFDEVVATPHMRPALFDNNKAGLTEAFTRAQQQLSAEPGLPTRSLSSEHYFDECIFGRILSGEALPYRGERAILLEFHDITFVPAVDQRLSELARRDQRPIIAHPERYPALWEHPELLDRLARCGAATLLDVAALVGKYGRRVRRCAQQLLDRELYDAACSDAHRPQDIKAVAQGMEWITNSYGVEELEALFGRGPRRLLGEGEPLGRVESTATDL